MNQTNETNSAHESDTCQQEKQPITMAARFGKAILMAAVMMMIGWAIGAV